ncbi:MAG TPA: hypothetical protein VGH27_16535 [Streptosporangiaceae bacterium]
MIGQAKGLIFGQHGIGLDEAFSRSSHGPAPRPGRGGALLLARPDRG